MWAAALAAAIVITVAGAQRAQAFPFFAKAYGVQCSTCHTIPPQLNSYGRYLQRTGYAALERDILNKETPVALLESPVFDTSSGSGRVEFGNANIQAAGFLGKDLTYHLAQWIVEDGQAGGLDTLQVTYSGLNKGNGHLSVGKIPPFGSPALFSNATDLSGFETAELTVGEHVYEEDAARWGAAYAYVGQHMYAQVGWYGSGADLSGATDFSQANDKTFTWAAAYADPNKPWEAGVFGTIGGFPLAEGGIDRYDSLSVYAQRDPGPHYTPGLFADYQWANDGNPGFDELGNPLGAAHSRAYTAELFEPLFDGRMILGLRDEYGDDGLGNISRTGAVDLAITPFERYQEIHLYFESGLAQNSTPAWRGMLWWAVPLGPGF